MMWKERTRTMLTGIKLTEETVRDILLCNEGLIKRSDQYDVYNNRTEHELVVHGGKLYDNGKECDIKKTRLFIYLHHLI